MKSRKLRLSIVIVCLAILIGIISWAIHSVAVDRVNYQIKVVNLRTDSGLGYRISRIGSEDDSKIKVWNLVRLNGEKAEELPLYCVQAELGFVADGVLSDTVTYDKAYDMKLISDKETLNTEYGESNLIIAKKENADIYSKVLWLADNMYVPGEDTVQDKINFLKTTGVINDEGTYNEYTLTDKVNILIAAGIMEEENKQNIDELSEEELTQYTEYIDTLFYSEFFISDDVIEVVQQLAYWYIIHSDDADSLNSNYHRATLPDLYYATEEGQDAKYEKLSEYYGEEFNVGKLASAIKTRLGQEYQNNAETLYEYLITETEKIDSTYFDKVKYEEEASKRVPVKLNGDKDTIKVEEDGENYIVGPYEIERTLAGEFELKTTVSVQNYKVLNSDKKEVKNVKKVVGDEIGKYQFYLSIPKTEDISGLSVKVDVTSNNRVVNLLLGEDAVNEQPVLIVENNVAEYSNTITLDKVFDLALRKVITGLEDAEGNSKLIVSAQKEGNSRTVVIDTDNLNKIVDGKLVTTATYKHRKDPVLVETGDIVTYTITVYNEGDAVGRATKIMDVLPDGLEFVEVVSGDYKVSQSIADNRIVFEKIGTENLDAFNGESLDSEEIVIKCRVTAEAAVKEQILTNIAVILEAYNAETETTITNQANEDRDSVPYIYPTEANTRQMADYQGHEDNKEDLSDKDYFYKGEEDDDDFEKLVLKGANYDLSLRKYITEVETKDDEGETTTKEYDREPEVDVDKINTYVDGKLITTADYNHTKTPVSVKVGDIVTYTIRVYNEGDIDGYVAEVTDYLPKWLEFLPSDELNNEYLWEYAEEGNTRIVRTEITSKDNATGEILYGTEGEETYRENGKLLKAYDPETMETLDYIDVKIRCKVVGTIDEDTLEPGEKVTNIAVITKMTDSSGDEIETDRDSSIDYENLPSDEELPSYKDDEINSGIEYIPGQEDDDDFEKVVIQVFDLALRKFIIEVDDGKEVTSYEDSRTPSVTAGTGNRDLDYTHPKDPIGVQNGNLVTYTIRVYNEGDIDGYAKEVADTIPEGLQFYSATVDGEDYRWVMYKEVSDSSAYEFEYAGKKYAETTSKEEATLIKTDYLSKAQETATGRTNLLKAFDKEDFEKNGAVDTAENKNPDYRDVKVTFLVTEPNTSTRILTNIAEITDDEDKDGNEVEDEDSTPGNDNYNFDDNNKNEDDIDFDRVKLLYFDLALRKFITEVEGTPINNRYPEVKEGTEGRDFDYEHTKKPVEVVSGDTVIYTIRVYNEGANAGYASEVMDDLPEGIIFLPEHATNIEYRWVMYKEAENGTYEYAGKKYVKTEDAAEADIIVTDYLDKEVSEAAGRDSLIKAYDAEKGITETNPDYRDIKVAFKVTEPNTSDRIIINTAEITRDEDEDGNEVKDKDSTPSNNDLDEDDIDKEYIKVKYFDLALLKWVSKVSVTQDGKTTVTDTGHTAETSRQEDPVMVTIDSKKIDSVVVKFIYDIRVENQGEIEGYAKEVKDHIPEGLVFKAEDNPGWTELEDGIITTDALKDTLLQPGETATVQVVLTWVNGDKNLNLKTNYAEISKDYNDWGIPDIDSTPDNLDGKPYEDDEDDAPVLLTLKTGQMPIYFILGFGILAVLVGGIYLIKKYVYRV